MADQLIQQWLRAFSEARLTLDQFLADEANLKACLRMSEIIIDTYKKGGIVLTCGNGGSHCDAMHFAEELTGRYRKDRPPLGALALGDPSHVTCVSNDYGFEWIFSRQLEALGRSGDALIGLSTSGNSRNVIRAFEVAQRKNLRTIALLGRDGGELKHMAELAIIVPAQTSDRIQEMHIKLLHILVESIERALYPDLYLNPSTS